MVKHTRCDMTLVERGMSLVHVQATEDLDNGTIAIIGDLVSGEDMVRVAVKPTTAALGTAKDKICIVHAPEIIYDESTKDKQQLKNFYNPAGTAIRGYRLSNVRRFKLSEEGIAKKDAGTALAVGQYVKMVDGSFKLQATTTASDAGVIGKIVRVDNEGIATYYDAVAKKFIGNVYPMYVIEVL